MSELERLLTGSLDALERDRDRRPIRCLCGCGIVFLDARTYFRHSHPSAGRSA